MNYFTAIRLSVLILFSVIVQFSWGQRGDIQYFRYYDQRGVNVFETSRNDSTIYDGFKIRLGANFTQGYQSIKHRNKGNVPLYDLSPGFPLAQANLNIDVQLVD